MLYCITIDYIIGQPGPGPALRPADTDHLALGLGGPRGSRTNCNKAYYFYDVIIVIIIILILLLLLLFKCELIVCSIWSNLTANP